MAAGLADSFEHSVREHDDVATTSRAIGKRRNIVS